MLRYAMLCYAKAATKRLANFDERSETDDVAAGVPSSTQLGREAKRHKRGRG